ncbi:MAG: protoheme IX farnesyltransferase, partial [Pseudomonadota bacterium]
APLIALSAMAGQVYLVTSIVLGAEFLRRAYALYRSTDNQGASGLFGFSIFYLFAHFLALLIEHWGGLHG